MREPTAYEIEIDLRGLRLNLAAALKDRARLRRPKSKRARHLDAVIARLRRQQLAAEVALRNTEKPTR